LLGKTDPLLEASEVRLLRRGLRPPLPEPPDGERAIPADGWWFYAAAVALCGLIYCWFIGDDSASLVLAVCGLVATAWVLLTPGSQHQQIAWVILASAICLLAVCKLGSSIAVRHPGEPWAVADGVCLWPGVFLRLLATVLALRFVHLAWADLRGLRDALTRRFFLEREGGKLGGIRHSGQPPTKPSLTRGASGLVPRDFPNHTDLDQGSNPGADSMAPTSLNEASEWDKYLDRSDPRMRRRRRYWFRITIATLAFSVAAMFLTNFPMANARGNLARWGDLLSLAAALGSLAVLCVFVGDQLWHSRNFIRHIWGHGTTGFGFEMEETLLLVARLTAGVGDLLAYPFVVCFVLLCAYSGFIEQWRGLLGLYAVVAIALGSLVVLTWKMQRMAHSVRARTVAYLQLTLAEAIWLKRLVLQRADFPDRPSDAASEEAWWRYTLRRLGRHLTLPELPRTYDRFEELNAAQKKSFAAGDDALKEAREDDLEFHEARIKRIEQLIALVNDIKEGAFGGLRENPIVRGVLIPGAGFGSLELIQRLLVG